MYSGRQFQLLIPLNDENGPTLVSSVLDRVRHEWPEEFVEMKEQVLTCPVKMLKTGELLTPAAPFTKYLSEKDLATIVSGESEVQKDGEKSNIIIHLVFQQKALTPPPATGGRGERPPVKRRENTQPASTDYQHVRRPPPDTGAQQDRTDDRPQNSGGCCLVM